MNAQSLLMSAAYYMEDVSDPVSTLLWIGLAILVALILVVVFLRFVPLGLWITSLAAGVHVSISSLVGMRLRRIQPKRLVEPLIKARKAGLDVTLSKLETHLLAGGNVDRVINALIAAQRSNIEMPFEKASAIDLAGRDVLQAVQMSVTPKVIETPVVAAIAKDGIELRAKARVTVRTNIERLVGGAGEETIIARVGEGIVTTVGSSETHKQVLENPDLISRTVLNKGLDAGTSFDYAPGDCVFVPGIRQAIENGIEDIPARVIRTDGAVEDLMLHVKGLTDDEKEIILDGCLMNYYAKRN